MFGNRQTPEECRKSVYPATKALYTCIMSRRRGRAGRMCRNSKKHSNPPQTMKANRHILFIVSNYGAYFFFFYNAYTTAVSIHTEMASIRFCEKPSRLMTSGSPSPPVTWGDESLSRAAKPSTWYV